MILDKIISLRQSENQEVFSLLEGRFVQNFFKIKSNDDSFKNVTAEYRYNGSIKSVFSSDFYRNLNDSNKSNPLLNLYNLPFPVSVRYMDNDCIVLERPPFKTSVRMSMARARRSKKEFNTEVWIPWTVWIVHFSHPDKLLDPTVKLYFNDKPLSSMDDVLCPAFTPNLFNDHKVCWGQTLQDWQQIKNQNPNQSIADFFGFFINDYFSGGWNLDLHNGHLMRLSMSDISMFKSNPLSDPVLSARAAKKKVKVKNKIQIKTEVSQLKNAYLIWSLLELDEVMESVSLYKEKFIISDTYSNYFNVTSKEQYSLSRIISNGKEDSNRYFAAIESSKEDTLISSVFKSCYNEKKILTNSIVWNIYIKTNEEFGLFLDKVFNDFQIVGSRYQSLITSPHSYEFNRFVNNYLNYYLEYNQHIYFPKIEEKINQIFTDSFSSHSNKENYDRSLNADHVINVDEISNDFYTPFVLWMSNPSNGFKFTDKKSLEMTEV